MAIPRKLAANFVATELDGEVLIVDMDGGELFSLAGTGAAIWCLIDGCRTIEIIATELGRDYANEPAISADVHALLKDLAAAGLVALG
ncbi:MAG: PqqD family protein [Qipengyuania sp.]